MFKKSKGFGDSVQKHNMAKLLGDETIIWRVPKENQLIVETDWDEQRKRIGEIIGFDEENELPSVDDQSLTVYGNYLKNNLNSPCYLTGIEDFSWEESYVFGYMSEKEHTKRRKSTASYLDTFRLIKVIVDPKAWSDIGVEVQRMEDGKKFELSLSYLEVTDRKSPNFQLLNDYVVWYWNYR